MSAANDLIERLERETGQRIDDSGSAAMAGLFGAMSRMLGQSPASYTARDDVVAGTVIQHQMTPEYKREQQGREMLAQLLIGGISPDDTKELLG